MFNLKIKQFFKKDIQERNHIIRWGVFVGLLAFICLSIFIYYIDFDALRDPNVVKDRHLRLTLLLVAGFLTIYIIHLFTTILANYLNTTYQKRFKHIPKLGTYVESHSKNYIPNKKYPHIVLLLHGFTASPQEFNFLIKGLQKEEIPYFAPTMIGFGLDNVALLSNIRYEDWFRSVLDNYDFLTTIADNVSIVGHSMGGILATYIAQNRRVNRLILVGPGIYSTKNDLKYKRMLTMPIVSTVIMKIFPYLPKPIRKGRKTTMDMLDELRMKKLFQYMAFPVRAGQQIFLAQDKIAVGEIKCQKLLVLYGRHDLTVDTEKLLIALTDNKIPYTSVCFENSAHSLLEDREHADVCQQVINFLK